MGGLGVQRSALTKVLLQVSAGHFHGRYDERDPRILGLSVLDPGETETDTKKAPHVKIFIKLSKLPS
jgi:hypothetical protein